MPVPRWGTRTTMSTSTPGPSCSKGGLRYPLNISLSNGYNANGSSNTYSLDSDLSGGWCIPTFDEQSGLVVYGVLVRPLFCAKIYLPTMSSHFIS